MTQLEILQAIQQLPDDEQRVVAETVLALLQGNARRAQRLANYEDRKRRMAAAAALMREEYLTDPELTIFTALDSEDFLEAR